MKRREDPAPEPPPVDRAKVRALLGEANAARERGENMHHHPTLLALEDVCDSIVAYYVFAFTSDDYRFSNEELDDLAERLVPRVAP